MKQGIYLLLVAFLMGGCNQGENKSVKMLNDTYHKVPTGYTTSTAPVRKSREERAENYQKEMELAKLKSEENLRLAKIEAEAKEEVKRIEAEALKAKVMAAKEVHLQQQKTAKEIAVTKEQRLMQTKEKDLRFYMILAAVVAALFLVALLVWYLMHRKNKATELKMHEDKLRHEAMMEANRQHHEKIGRVLEIIADKHTDPAVKHKLVSVLSDQSPVQHLIAYESEEGVSDVDALDEEDGQENDSSKKEEEEKSSALDKEGEQKQG